MKRENFHKKLDVILDVFLGKHNFDNVTIDGNLLSWDTLEIGSDVSILIAGETATSPAPDGDYKISDTQSITVANGKIESINDIPVVDVSTGDASVGMTIEPVQLAVAIDASVANVPAPVVDNTQPVVEPVIDTLTAGDDLAQVLNLDGLSQLIDISKDGFYQIEFSICEGVVIWGNLNSNVSLAKEENIDTLKANFLSEIEKLGQTIKETKVVQAPVEKQTNDKPLTKQTYLSIILDEKRKEKNLI
jgi:hypothetical protein